MPLQRTTGEGSQAFKGEKTDNSDFADLIKSNNIYNKKNNQWYTTFNRFGCIDPYNGVSNTREYLFFTKPDLHIYEPGTRTLNPELSNSSFFNELHERYPDVIGQLQRSIETEKTRNFYPFMNILSNTVKNTLDMPEITSEDIDTSATIFGTSITYRGDGWSSDENYEFSLEFEDTRYLELYHLFKAYDEYEKLKRIGIVTPPNINGAEVLNGVNYNSYIENRELHDQFALYKIVVDEDYQKILYYAWLCGVYPKTVPRESFSDIRLDNGLRHTVTFKAQFIDDMKPYILANLNTLINNSMALTENSTFLDIYDSKKRRVDGTWATVPWITKNYKSDYGQWLGPNSMKYDYNLRWRMR